MYHATDTEKRHMKIKTKTNRRKRSYAQKINLFVTICVATKTWMTRDENALNINCFGSAFQWSGDRN